jgi:hypothetical protein
MNQTHVQIFLHYFKDIRLIITAKMTLSFKGLSEVIVLFISLVGLPLNPKIQLTCPLF